MSGRIITLFGEEFAPEEQKPAAKGKARKKTASGEAEEPEAEEPQSTTIDVIPAPGASVSETPAPFPAGPVSIAESEPYTAPSIAGELPATLAAETYTEPEIVPEPVAEIVVTPTVPVTFDEPAFTVPPIDEAVPEATEEHYTEEPVAPVAAVVSPDVFEEPAATAEPLADYAPEVIVDYTEDYFAPVAEVPQPAVPEPAPQPQATVPAEKKVIAKKSKRTPKETIEEEEPATDAGPSQNIPEDWQGDKTYYTIGEVAALFNVKTSHIRFWTNEFKLRVRTTRKGDRLYSPSQVKEIRVIYHLVKERGFTLAGAKARLKTQNNKDSNTVDLKDSLKNLRGQLQAIRDSL